jgi:NADH:ubiquinone oxidoreductase subunit E
MPKEVVEKKVEQSSEFTPQQFAELEAAIESFRGKSGSTIRTLSKAQEIFGYLPKEVQSRVAKGLGIPMSEIYGIATFYSFFSLVPKGKHTISSCQGTACYVRGGKQVMDELKSILGIDVGGTTEDRQFSLDSVRCVGACALAPVVRVDDDVYRQMSPKKLKPIIAKYSDSAEGE